MSEEPMILVTIECTERVRYSITRSIPASHVAEYEAAKESGERDRWFADFAERYIDRQRDCFDGDELEDVEMQIEALDGPAQESA